MTQAERLAALLPSGKEKTAKLRRPRVTVPPYHDCAVIDASGPRRSNRKRTLSVRLQPIRDTPARRLPVTGSDDLASVLSADATTSSLPAASPGEENIQSEPVEPAPTIQTGGGMPQESNAESVIDRALRTIADAESLRSMQRRD